jgi:hypothetical protein
LCAIALGLAFAKRRGDLELSTDINSLGFYQQSIDEKTLYHRAVGSAVVKRVLATQSDIKAAAISSS